MNFPVLIRLINEIFDFTTAQNNGADIRFTDSKGNVENGFKITSSGKKITVRTLTQSVLKNNDGTVAALQNDGFPYHIIITKEGYAKEIIPLPDLNSRGLGFIKLFPLVQ